MAFPDVLVTWQRWEKRPSGLPTPKSVPWKFVFLSSQESFKPWRTCMLVMSLEAACSYGGSLALESLINWEDLFLCVYPNETKQT